MNLRFRHAGRLRDVPPEDWDRVFESAYPFTRHAWLSKLEEHGCVCEQTGWEPRHLLAEDADGQLVGAAPLYLKHHSYGEFVFDFAWADASHRIGQRYYPKLLNAIPYVPSIGPRLAGSTDQVRAAMAQALAKTARSGETSSLHCLFANDQSAGELRGQGLLERNDIQFRWTNQAYDSFQAFAAQLSSSKRKKMLRERRRVSEAGIGFEVARGTELTDSDWDQVYQLYTQTYYERGQAPYFTRDFLADAGNCASLDLHLIFAVHEGRRVAVAITLVGGDTLYGRHWGAEAHYHSLHFECCYYQGIELCIAKGLNHFDAGTQGAHKHGRGFLPELTRSFHVLEDARLHQAVADYLQRERAAVAARFTDLVQHSPYRTDMQAGHE